jgi:hypothetical protein
MGDHEPRSKWVAFIPNDVAKCHFESIFRAKQSIACCILIKDKQSQNNYNHSWNATIQQTHCISIFGCQQQLVVACCIDGVRTKCIT